MVSLAHFLRRLVATPRREAAAVGVLIAFVYLVGTVSYGMLVGGFNDDAVYIALGRALADGQGYRSIHLAGAPVHEKFPPGLPIILALLWRIGGSIGAVQALGVTLAIVVSAIAAALLWWYARQELVLSPWLAGAFVALPFCLDATIQYFTMVISEPWFVLAWAVVLIAEARLAAISRGRAVGQAVALGLLLAATVLLRAQGALLAIATIAVVIARGRTQRWRESAACALAIALPLLAWHWYHERLMAVGPLASQADESYVRFIGGDALALMRTAPRVAAENIAYYAPLLASSLSRVPLVGAALAAVAALLAGVGMWRAVRERPLLAIAIMLNVLVVVGWPFTQDRLLLTLLPFVGIVMAMGAQRLLRHGARPAGIAAVAMLAVSAAVVLENQVAIHRSAAAALRTGSPPIVRSPDFYLPVNAYAIGQVAQWVVANTRPDERVASWFPAAIFLYSGRAGVPSSPAENIARAPAGASAARALAARIVEHRVTVIVLESAANPAIREIAAIFKTCPGTLQFQGWIGQRSLPAAYRLSPDDPCLRAMAGLSRDPGPVTPPAPSPVASARRQ